MNHFVLAHKYKEQKICLKGKATKLNSNNSKQQQSHISTHGLLSGAHLTMIKPDKCANENVQLCCIVECRSTQLTVIGINV